MKKIEKYRPAVQAPPAKDLAEAKRVALQICEAFSANFQNDETDLAHMITDKFSLRNAARPPSLSEGGAALVRRALALEGLSPAARALEEKSIVRELGELEKP